MKTVRMTIDPAVPATLASGRIDPARVDATTEADIAKQAAADEAEAMQDPQLTPAWLDRWAPWLTVAVLLVVLVYGPNLFVQLSNMTNTSPGFNGLW